MKKWKEPFFYLYDVPRIRIHFIPIQVRSILNPFFLYFFHIFSFVMHLPFFHKKPSHKDLYGAAKTRVEVALEVAKKINLKALITRDNLKRVVIFSERVESRYEFIKFRNGVFVLPNIIMDNDDEEFDVVAYNYIR